MSKTTSSDISYLLSMMADGGDCTRCFEVELTKFVTTQTDKSLFSELWSHGEDTLHQYLGFYGLQVFYRHRMQYDALKEMFLECGDTFSQFQSYKHLHTLYYIESSDYFTLGELDEHLASAKRVVDEYRKIARDFLLKNKPKECQANLAGVQHAFADLLATSCERFEESCTSLLNKWGKQAEYELSQAIKNSDEYAKYFCTQGRLYSLRDEYDKAIHSIRTAISREASSNNPGGFSLRIMQYQSHLLRVQARSEIHQLNIQQAKMADDVHKIRDSLINNVEIIAFFSGVISFIIGSLNLTEAFPAPKAAGLIIVLLGALLLVFNCFSFILHLEKKNLLARILIFVISILCILGGLYLVL